MNVEKTAFLVDSNVFVYAHDADSGPKQENAAIFISKKMGEKKFFVSAQTLGEIYAVITEKIQKPLSHIQARKIITELSELASTISYSPITVVSACRICEEYKTHFWDALLAATMIENNIRIIYTENTKDFEKIKEITAINPLK